LDVFLIFPPFLLIKKTLAKNSSYNKSSQKKKDCLVFEQNNGYNYLHTICLLSCVYFGGRQPTDTFDHLLKSCLLVNVKIREYMEPYCEV